MTRGRQLRFTFTAAMVAISAVSWEAYAQSDAPTNDAPNPYRTVEGWAKLPEGRKMGSTSAVDIDRDGKSVWVAERCGANSCLNRTTGEMSPLNPILHFDPSGKLLTSFGAGMFVFPHGIFVDKDNNVWVADANGMDGKGHTVVKFSSSGKVLMTLGKPGVAGDGADTFNRPTGVVVAPSGEIFVSDGHGGDSN